MKNITYKHLFSCLIFFIVPTCWSMVPSNNDSQEYTPERQKEDTDEFRKYVLSKAAYESLETLTSKVNSIIADGYRSIETLTDREQHYLLCDWKNRQKKNELIPYTEEVFFGHLENLVQQKEAYVTYLENLSDEEENESHKKRPLRSTFDNDLNNSTTFCSRQSLLIPEQTDSEYPDTSHQTSNLPTILIDFVIDTPEVFRQKYGNSNDSDLIPELPDSQEAGRI